MGERHGFWEGNLQEPSKGGSREKMVGINTQNRRIGEDGSWVGDCCPTSSHQTPKMTMKKADPHGTLCKSYPLFNVYHLFSFKPFFFLFLWPPKSKKAAPI